MGLLRGPMNVRGRRRKTTVQVHAFLLDPAFEGPGQLQVGPKERGAAGAAVVGAAVDGPAAAAAAVAAAAGCVPADGAAAVAAAAAREAAAMPISMSMGNGWRGMSSDDKLPIDVSSSAST